MRKIEDFELTEYYTNNKGIYKFVSEKDYAPFTFKGKTYYRLVQDKDNYLRLPGRLCLDPKDGASRFNHAIRKKPLTEPIRYYNLTFEQLINYVTGNYQYSIILSAYLTSLFFNIEEKNRINKLYKYVLNTMPNEIKQSMRFLTCNYGVNERFNGWLLDNVTQHNKLFIRNNYINNRHIIDNLEIDLILTELYNSKKENNKK